MESAVPDDPDLGADAAGVDGHAFRAALGRFPTGVAVIGVHAAGVDHAMTANSFASVSLTPPLVLVCVRRDARTHGLILDAGRWTASVLAGDQEDTSRAFATRGEIAAHLATTVRHRGALTGAPLFDGALAEIECATVATHPGGDHTIVVGQVLAAAVREPARPALIFHRGGYTAIG
ncbi:MAG: flavin reductase family protein [Mycobacteriales bacterium]